MLRPTWPRIDAAFTSTIGFSDADLLRMCPQSGHSYDPASGAARSTRAGIARCKISVGDLGWIAERLTYDVVGQGVEVGD